MPRRAVRGVWRRSVVGVLAPLVLLVAAGCGASDSGNASDGSETERPPAAKPKERPAVPVGSHKWRIRRPSNGVWCKPDDDGHKPEAGGGNCAAPAWEGTFDVARDGAVTGTGKLSNGNRQPGEPVRYDAIICASGEGPATVTATQDVTVTGESRPGRPTVLEFSFGEEIEFGGTNPPKLCKRDVMTGKSIRRPVVDGMRKFFAPGETATATLDKATGKTTLQIGPPKDYILYW